MKIILFITSIYLFVGCTNNQIENDCIPFTNVNESLNIEQFIDLQIPGGWIYTDGGLQGLIIYNLNGIQFKAFDRLCPGQNLSSCSKMIVDSNLRIVCPCNNNEYNILNGAPLNGDKTCFAKQYFVENLNGSLLRITNF